jgi:hypothetical protein
MGDFRKLDTHGADSAYAFVRRAPHDPRLPSRDDHAVVVVTNLSASPISITLAPQPNAGSIDGSYVELFSEHAASFSAGSTLSLEPWGFRVFVQGPRSAP